MNKFFSTRAVALRSIMLRCLALIAVMAAMSTASFGQFRVAISFGPPALPVYEQPLCPGEGYIWTPGYWSWDDDIEDYYWVPGTWVLAPEVGFLWTPGWWGWGSDAFIFHEGYWGPKIGFYGGINYGFGYFGVGFEGGRWDNGRFFYNRSVTNVNITEIHNVYNTTVINNRTTVTRVSFNGGNGGIQARPSPQEEAAARARHIPPVSAQAEHVRAARSNPQMRASTNQGRPPVAATQRPGEFSGRAVVPAREAGAPYHPPANRAPANRGGARENRPAENARPGAENRPENNGSRPGNVVHPRDIARAERPPAANSGNGKADQRYQKQQEKLAGQQEKERQKLQARQDREHQQAERQHAAESRTQQMEQKHQQQTQQLQQKHEAQQQRMQQRQQPARQSEPKPPKSKY